MIDRERIKGGLRGVGIGALYAFLVALTSSILDLWSNKLGLPTPSILENWASGAWVLPNILNVAWGQPFFLPYSIEAIFESGLFLAGTLVYGLLGLLAGFIFKEFKKVIIATLIVYLLIAAIIPTIIYELFFQN